MVQVAYSPDGNPSKALQGFCKKNGVSVDSVTTEADSKGTEYVWAIVKQPGRSASEVCTSRPYSPCSHFAKYISTLAVFLLAASQHSICQLTHYALEKCTWIQLTLYWKHR